MGILDKLFARKQQDSSPEKASLAGRGTDFQTDEQKAGTRSRMEAEMQGNREGREAAARDAAQE